MTNRKITTTQIASYIWFPTEHKEVTEYLTANVGSDYSINSVVLMPLLTLVGGAAGAVLCVMKSQIPYMMLIPAFVGVIGAWGFLTKPAYQLGSNWVFQLIICIALLVFAVAAMVYSVKKQIDESKKADRE